MQSIIQIKADQKARQGVFFMSLCLLAVGVVLVMLFSLLGYMLYRGAGRLFYSPVYELTFADGKTWRTNLNQSLEFDCVEPGGEIVTRGANQAAKAYLNQMTEAIVNAQAPIPAGMAVEVWRDKEIEVADPWEEDNPNAARTKQTVQEKIESLSGAREVKFDSVRQSYVLTLADGKTRALEGVNLQFRQNGALLSLKTLVTRHLQNHPEEKERRQREAERQTQALAAGEQKIDPRWKAWLVEPAQATSADGRSYYKDQRHELKPVASLRPANQWNWLQFFWDFPRAGNTEGGVLPCIFGTVMMTLIMTVVVAPFGVATAVYLNEYARPSFFTRSIRIAIANLAGVPSIVFGLFGLGFFVLTIGSGIDHAFYGGSKVFGTPCVLWASLTMALLTLPVMIVASEEALRAVPADLREASLALGATKFHSIITVVLPTALPGILTGAILSVARGAGEVAPLLLTGVIAQKDQLPRHPLEKFMDLAYHVYDLSVKSQPNKIEEAQALAFSAAMVLVMVVLMMNLAAILLRARLSRFKPV